MADRLRRQRDIITRKTNSYLNATTKAYTEMYDGTPTFVTYYQIDSANSTEDVGLEAVNSLTGSDCPLKYRKIEDVKVYGIDALDVSNEISERGLISAVSGDFVIKPNSIIPSAGDFFTFDYEGMEDHLFRVNDVQFDKITPEKYYKCSFSLYPYNTDDILNNVSGDFNMTYNQDGSSGGESSVISSSDAGTSEATKALVDNLIEKYETMFYDEDTDSFIYSDSDINYWSPYLQRFLHDTKALSKYNQELLTEIYIGNINESDYPSVFKEKFYRDSLFKNIISKNPKLTFDQTFMSVDKVDLKYIRNLPYFNSPLKYRVIRPVDIWDRTGLDYQNAFLVFMNKCPCKYDPPLPEYDEEAELHQHNLVKISDNALEELKNAVYHMSEIKQGALIVLMGKDDIFKNGTVIQPGTVVNHKVEEKYLTDMFIEGTPLHDGAAIINGDIILNAAAFVEPSKDPVHGKFGSRHQAALGISETSDAITILVSEETGNVSIAFNGRMSTYLKGDFIAEIKADYAEIEKREDKKVSKFKLTTSPFAEPGYKSLTFFRDADHYHKVHILDELHLARLEDYIKPGDVVYECYRHELEPTKVVEAVDINGQYTELRDISLPGLMENNYVIDDMRIFYIIKDYLNGNLSVDEDLISELSDYFFEQDIQNYILMPILIYILKQYVK